MQSAEEAEDGLPKEQSRPTKLSLQNAVKGKFSQIEEINEKHHKTKITEKIESLEKAPEASLPRRFASRIVHSHWFEHCMGVVIVFNVVALVIETNRGADENVDSSELHWTEPCSWAVLVIFIMEMILRLYVHRMAFWVDGWNLFDFAVILTDTMLSIVGLAGTEVFPVSVLRITRLGKLVRVSKVLRVFPELRLLLASLASSITTIFWGGVLLFFCLLVWSLVAVAMLHPLNKNMEYDGCERCPRAWSSVANAALTLFQQVVAGDSWGQASIPMMEKYPSTVMYFITAHLTIGMAVLNLIFGVVVSVAQQAKEDMESEDAREATILAQEKHTHLIKLCIELDADGDGELDKNELIAGFQRPGEFRDALVAMDISLEEIEIIWKLVDPEGKQSVPYEDALTALYSLNGSNTEFMLAYIKHYIKKIRDDLKQQMSQEFAWQQEEELKIEDEIHKNNQQLNAAMHEVEAITYGHWDVLPGERDQAWEKASPNTGRGVNITSKLPLTNQESHAWLNKLCNDMATMRVELKDILMNMNGKQEPFESPVFIPSQGNTKKASLSVTSGRNPSSSVSQLPCTVSELTKSADGHTPMQQTKDSCLGAAARTQKPDSRMIISI